MMLRRLFGRRRASCRATAADTSPPSGRLPGSPAEAAGFVPEPDPGRWVVRVVGMAAVGLGVCDGRGGFVVFGLVCGH